MMTRCIYVLANDAVMDYAIALLASIRERDSVTPVMMIPYDDRAQKVAAVLGEHFGVRPYEDMSVLKRIDNATQEIFGSGFFWRPNMFRKQAVWFGPFDQFLYLDADIIESTSFRGYPGA